MNFTRQFYDAVSNLPAFGPNLRNPHRELRNRHDDFLFQMLTAGIFGNSINNCYKRPFIEGYRAAVYSKLVSCLNLRQVTRMGTYGEAYNTSWGACVNDVVRYMNSEEQKERRMLADAEQARRRNGAGMFGDMLELREEIDENWAFVSKPLCVIVGRNPETSAVLIIFKEEGVWKAILKFAIVPRVFQPFNLVYFMLKKLNIGRVKLIPGNPALHGDPLKENYKVCGKMFDVNRKFLKWKNNFTQSRFIFDVQEKCSLMTLNARARN